MNYLILSVEDFPNDIDRSVELLDQQIKLEEIKQALNNASHEKIVLLKNYVRAHPDKFERDEVSGELANLILTYPSP